MPETLDAFRYISYMRSRWRWILASCAVAVALALAGSIVATRQYTATTRIVIDPPAGTDLRSTMAVSPVYLESLKTYEQFAAGDSIFSKAFDKLQLRPLVGKGAVESIKARVLKVGLLRNTRILEIAVTLPDPRKAQALAQFLAESTVDLNRGLVSETDQELLKGIEQQERDARVRLQETDAAWARLLAAEPITELQASLENTAKLRATVQQQVLNVQLEIADATERLKQATGGDATEIRKEQTNARARLDEMNHQLQAIDTQTAEREKLLAGRFAHRDTMEADRKATQTVLAGIENHLREVRGETGYRGERLRIIDPGVVPERPSSPNIPLNVGAALLAGLVLPLLCLTFAMAWQEQRGAQRRFMARGGQDAA
jgi:uncharacterized protein involved in exopolysaccharide biosynthesis